MSSSSSPNNNNNEESYNQAAIPSMEHRKEIDDSLSSGNSAAVASTKSAIDFLTMARGLKTTKRTGWVMQQVPKVESVADHSWRMTLMAMVATSSAAAAAAAAFCNEKERNKTIDASRCIQMAAVHDLAEAIVGDITPHCGVSNQDKYQMELKAMTKMTDTLSSTSFSAAGSLILDLWKEYEQGETPEAKLVKDLDKLEMILQAQEYEQDAVVENAVVEGKNGDGSAGQKDLSGFFTSTQGKWKTEMGQQWANEIVARRRQPESPGETTVTEGEAPTKKQKINDSEE